MVQLPPKSRDPHTFGRELDRIVVTHRRLVGPVPPEQRLRTPAAEQVCGPLDVSALDLATDCQRIGLRHRPVVLQVARWALATGPSRETRAAVRASITGPVAWRPSRPAAAPSPGRRP